MEFRAINEVVEGSDRRGMMYRSIPMHIRGTIVNVPIPLPQPFLFILMHLHSFCLSLPLSDVAFQQHCLLVAFDADLSSLLSVFVSVIHKDFIPLKHSCNEISRVHDSAVSFVIGYSLL